MSPHVKNKPFNERSEETTPSGRDSHQKGVRFQSKTRPQHRDANASRTAPRTQDPDETPPANQRNSEQTHPNQTKTKTRKTLMTNH